MTFKCKDSNNVIRNVTWIYRKNAWIPVVTVCTYALYPQVLIPRVIPEVLEIPDVIGLNLQLENLGLIISWTNNSAYLAEVSTSISENEWTVNVLEPNQNTFVFEVQPEVTVQVRVRFTDGEDRFSPNYTTASMTIWELADFNLFGLTESGRRGVLGHSVYTLNLDNEEYISKLKTFTEENIFESQVVLSATNFDNGRCYRLIDRNRDNYSGYEFETINLLTGEVTQIPINYADNYNLCNATSMCYNPLTTAFLVHSACGFYQIDTYGFATKISDNNYSNKGLVIHDDVYLTLIDYSGNNTIALHEVDIANGSIGNSIWNISLPGYILNFAYSLTSYNGILYAIVGATEDVQDGYSGLILISLDFSLDQISFISQLPAGCEIMTSLLMNEETKLIIQDYQNKGLYFLSSTGEVENLIVSTARCCNLEDYQSMSFNPIDGHIYHAVMRNLDYDPNNEEIDPEDDLNFVFEKLNPDTLEVTPIQVSGDVYFPGVQVSTSSYINDGGGDMYDGGNFLSTNITENGYISYTHTQQTNSDYQDFVEIADGNVENGNLYFGESSEYFTNLYSGLFVMVARNISITDFYVTGELGADGSGIVSQDTVTLNNGYTGYFKKVYDAGDPSVNHLIIVPTGQNIRSIIVQDTNDDFHRITGLENTDHIYYLLFSTEDSELNEITSEQAQIIGNSFLDVVSGQNTISGILSALNSNVNEITTNIPDMFVFSDYAEDPRSYPIGRIPGLQKPRCMVYKSDNSFLIIDNNASFYSITSDGIITLINSNWWLENARALAFVGDRLFVSYSNLGNLVELNPNTGEIINQVEDKKGPLVWVDNSNINNYSIRSMAAVEDLLYIITYDDGDTFTLSVINNLVPNELNLIHATSIMSLGEVRFVGGLTSQLFGKLPPNGEWFWSYNEEQTVIEIRPTENLTEINLEDLEVQWHSNRRADQSDSDWNSIDVEEVIVQENGYFWVLINKTANNFKIRMRYLNPTSKWSYYEWD